MIFFIRFFIVFCICFSVTAQETLNSDYLKNWNHAYHIKLNFSAQHPQGLIKLGDYFFLSTYDKDEEQGYIIKFDFQGNLVAQSFIGTQGSRYHTSGIDTDGRYIYIAMSERKADSTAEFFIVDPDDLTIEQILDQNGQPYVFNDHIGTIIFDYEKYQLIGLNWDSKNIYTWDFFWDKYMDTKILKPKIDKYSVKKYINSSTVAYQDCKFSSKGRFLCSGYQVFGAAKLPFHAFPSLCRELSDGCGTGHIDMLDTNNLKTRPQAKVDSSIYAVRQTMSYNAFWFSTDEKYFFFIPDDDENAHLEGFVRPDVDKISPILDFAF